ncbi:MAG: DUF1415 domain-containing protein [Thiobacillus sp.]|nr:DUF1415 domain-containing protein [Thiobacillus sp.]
MSDDEVIAAMRQWIEKAVIGLNLCPFARAVYDDMGNFTSRAPFPAPHLLREASIERAVADFPEAETIYARNIETLAALGHAGWNSPWAPPSRL